MEVVAVGDISLGDSWQGVGGGVHARFERIRGENRSYPFEHVTSLFQGAQIAFGNLETVLSHRGLVRRKASSMEMRGHPGAAERLAAAGFTALNVANNHMMQHGIGAFSETVESLRRHGMSVVGLADETHRGCIPQTVSANGITATLLGFAFEKDKYAPGPVEYAFGPDCDIPGQVAAAKERSDLVICSVHWGVEFVRHPSAAEEALGRSLVDAGADLVIGHHPHVARRVERYGRGLIAYSLGNFVFDMLWNPWLRTGLVLRVRLSRNGVEHHETELVWIGDDYQPRPLSGEERGAAGAFDALQQRPEWVAQDDQYTRHYEELVARNRYESYGHFLRNTKHRPLSYTVQTVLRTARRKAAGMFSVKPALPSGHD
jgi:poly-gamma-glutamate synthesis protein (capsule biosynthesis protein)